MKLPSSIPDRSRLHWAPSRRRNPKKDAGSMWRRASDLRGWTTSGRRLTARRLRPARRSPTRTFRPPSNTASGSKPTASTARPPRDRCAPGPPVRRAPQTTPRRHTPPSSARCRCRPARSTPAYGRRPRSKSRLDFENTRGSSLRASTSPPTGTRDTWPIPKGRGSSTGASFWP
jgi:hypothetical protein